VLETTWQDVRYGYRLLLRSPLFTLTAALSLAIGIGANTSIFSVASAMLLRPLPGIAEPARLVDIGRTQNGKDFDNSSYPNYRDIRARVTTLSGVYAIKLESQPMGLGGQDGAERIYGSIVSANYFSVLGTRAIAGRLLTDADDEGAPGSHPVIVISYELWQRRFGGRPDAIGQTVPLNGYPFVIVGVTPPGFQGTTVLRSDAWVPITATPLASPRREARLLQSRPSVWLLMGGRLKPGVTVAQANAELTSIGAALEREFPDDNRGKGLVAMRSAVVPGHIDVFAGFLGLLMAIVGLVLLIACVNLSGMMLARAAGRRREIALRLAIGASRWRLARQLLTETALLFVAGCALGLLLTRWLRALLLALLPQLPVPLGIDMPTDGRVLGFAIALSLVAAVLCGLAPALQASGADLVPALKAEGGGTIGGRLRLRSAFLVGQVALSLLLVLTAGLFMRALGHAASIQPGFDQRQVDVAMLDLSLARYTDTTGPAFARDLVNRAALRPGVRSAALVSDLPLDGGRQSYGAIRTPGLRRGNTDQVNADWNVISPGYFRTLEIALLRGRDFTDADTTGAPRVGIVNEAMARAIWGTPDALGRTIEVNDSAPGTWEPVTIVGIAANAQVMALGGTVDPYLYVPLAQRYTPRVSLVVKNAGGSAIPQVRALVHEMNPNLPIAQAMPLSDVTAVGLIPQRIAAGVAGSLGIVGLLLAAIGIYGVTSYSVARRVREIGIRVALGADGSSVLRLILRQGFVLTLAGVGIGLAAGALVSQVVRSLLLGVASLDPVTFGGGAALFLVVALAASYLPARRATKVDPMVALRAE
jgi:putative ABC transport system permease protein